MKLLDNTRMELRTSVNNEECGAGGGPENPVCVVRSMFPQNKKRSAFGTYQNTESDDEDYTMEAVRAIRAGDVALLRQLLSDGANFDACNRNGETLLHLACRRGDVATVRFLIEEANVAVDARDDLGRTVLHDVCWRPSPNTDLMDVIVHAVHPMLLLAEDRRGHTPFDYTRKHDWAEWNKYLCERRAMIEYRALML